MKYGIFLSIDNGEEGFQIPINPGEISMTNGNDGSTYNISEVGEINVIKDKALIEFQFSSFFPIRSYSFLATNKVLQPKTYVDYIQSWMDQKTPIRFIYTGTDFDVNTLVSVDNFEWKELAGTMGDIEYDLSLKQYRDYAPKKVKVSLPQTSSASIQKQKKERPNTKKAPKTYRLVAGDSLWKVAQKKLGNGNRWPEIQRLNNISDSELRRLPIGLEVKLPAA